MDETHVKTLEETVRGGAWGQTTLVRPSVLQVGEKKCTPLEDGRYVLNNGLHAVKALMNVAAEVETMEESPIWVNAELAEIFVRLRPARGRRRVLNAGPDCQVRYAGVGPRAGSEPIQTGHLEEQGGLSLSHLQREHEGLVLGHEAVA